MQLKGCRMNNINLMQTMQTKGGKRKETLYGKSENLQGMPTFK
jgi:hypothetical protein